MEITINKKNLLDTLNGIGRIAKAKSPMPILQTVKIDIRKDGYMVVSASDIDMSAMRKFKAADSFEAALSFCIDPHDLAQVLKSLREEEVTLFIDNNTCTVGHRYGSMLLPIMESDVFPVSKIDKGAQHIVVEAKQLFNWLKKAVNFVSNDDFRPAMCGVYIYQKDGNLGVCATDTRMLYNEEVRTDSDICVDGILATKAIAYVLDIINDEENVTIYFGEKKLGFRTETALLLCSKPNGRFPDFKRIIRKDNPIHIEINKNKLVDSINRATLSADSTTMSIKMIASDGLLRINSEDLITNKRTKEELPCAIEGGDVSLCVNGKCILECINSINAENVVFGLVNATTAINLVDAENLSKNVILMPMNI